MKLKGNIASIVLVVASVGNTAIVFVRFVLLAANAKIARKLTN